MNTKTLATQTILLVIVVFLQCTSTLSAADLTGTLLDIKQSGKIKIGYRTSLPPLSFVNNKGEVEGYSIDLCKLIVADVEKKLDEKIDIEYIAVSPENRFDALVQKKIDILCGAATETISRREKIDFTQHIFVTGGSYMVRKGAKLRNNFAGKKIGVVRNTTTARALADLFQQAGIEAEIKPVKTTADGFNSLLDGEIDAFSADQVVLIGLIMAARSLGEFRLLPDLFSFEPIALAVRKNDADFRLVADKVLADLYRCEEIQAIYEKWFGAVSDEQPPAVKAVYQLNALPE